MIFPGMDPWLEEPRRWREVHNAFIVYMRDQIQPRLPKRYVAAVDARIYFTGGSAQERYPDVSIVRDSANAPSGGVAIAEPEVDEPLVVTALLEEINESFVDVLDLENNERIVTSIELLSPKNKYAGPGRKAYLKKQRAVLKSESNLVEIDLLRAGPHVLAVPQYLAQERDDYQYMVCVNRIGSREQFELYPRLLQQKLPVVRVPLATGDTHVPLDLQAVLDETYRRGAMDRRIRYDRPCRPALNANDQAWADELIRESGWLPAS